MKFISRRSQHWLPSLVLLGLSPNIAHAQGKPDAVLALNTSAIDSALLSPDKSLAAVIFSSGY